MATTHSSAHIVDTLIIGGGPAGLMAAVYLGRALRTVIVIDAELPGRSKGLQVNHNFLGFPDGVPIRDLVCRGREQAEKYGATFVDARVTSVEQEAANLFRVHTNRRVYRARTIVVATGVTDQWVEFPGSEAYIGRSMHWCVVCDGYEMQGQRVLVVGDSARAVVEARQLRRFTEEIMLLVDMDKYHVTPDQLHRLEAEGISIHYGRIASAACTEPGMCTSIMTDKDKEISVDHIFSVLGSTPNVDFAAPLALPMNKDGFIQVSTEARTALAGVYAAGDVTRLHSHQVVTAAHEGATAAMAIAFDLWTMDNP